MSFHTQRTIWLEIHILGDPFLPSGFLDVTPQSLLQLITSEPTLDTGTLWIHTGPWLLSSGAILMEPHVGLLRFPEAHYCPSEDEFGLLALTQVSFCLYSVPGADPLII